MGTQARPGCDFGPCLGQVGKVPCVTGLWGEGAEPGHMVGDQIADRAAAMMDCALCCEGLKRPPAPRAIGIGRDNEAVLISHEAACVTQLADALRLWIDQRAGQVVSRRLCEVDPVAEPVDHVEMMPRHVRVEQRLRHSAGRDLVKTDRGAFQPVAQVRACDE
nr:hypothetical protein [Roseovarius tolerans]